jgi:6-phosphogluconolactonase (cycloisomerase 2 family)
MELPELAGAVGVQISPDDEFAAVCAFGANALSLFKRDRTTGELLFLDAAIEGKDGATGLRVAVDVIFSADSRFLYSGSVTGIGIFQIEKDKLVFVREENAGGRLKDVRGFAVSPDGNFLYAAATESGTVGVFRRDKKSGALVQVQVLADGEDGNNALGGAFRIACSRDGRHVYVSSGRLKGDQAISVFETLPDGKLRLMEERVNGEGDFTGFKGGNGIAISPGGTLVYAAATVSDRLVRFRRDSQTGKLTFLGSQSVGAFSSPGACALAFSPDEKFVYVADEDSNSIVVFKQP